jgi:hypothetical protein
MRDARCLHGLGRAHGVALDAGNLHQAADGIAGHAQVVLHGDFGGVLHLSIGSAQSAAVSPPAAMEQATPTSPWQPTSAPLMDAFSLYRMPMAAEVRKKRRCLRGLPRE